MKHVSLSIIRDEHLALSAMLRSMLMLIDKSHRDGSPPAFDVLRAMLLYIDEFPERRHHQHENHLLFPMIRIQVPDLTATSMPTSSTWPSRRARSCPPLKPT